MVRASVLASSVSWVRIPPEQRFFLFGEKRVVWVSCLPLFSIYRKEFSCIDKSMHIVLKRGSIDKPQTFNNGLYTTTHFSY